MIDFLIVFLFTFICIASGILLNHTIRALYESQKERKKIGIRSQNKDGES